MCNAPSVMRYRNVLGFVVVLPRSKVRPSVGFMESLKVVGRLIVHGQGTREKRLKHSLIMSELRCLEEIGYTCGLYPVGTPRIAGRKPLGYPASAGDLEHLLR